MKEDNTNMSDELLLKQYKNTLDKKNVGILYKRYAHLVLAVCYKYFNDKEESKDAVTQIFEKLFIELQKREINNFKSWLIFVCKNHCISELRKKNVEAGRRNEFLNKPAEEYDSTEHLAVEKKYNDIEKAIEQLPEKQKLCIKLFYYENHSYDDIANKTGFNSNEVKSYIQNGKRNLKIYLSNK